VADPKAGREAKLYAALDAATTYPVYNTEAVGTEYVVFQASGGNDDWWHGKKRGYTYEYEIVGVSTNRNTALALNAAITGAMAMGAALAPTGFGLVAVTRVLPIDYTQNTDDAGYIHHVGGIYEIEVEES